MKQRMLCPASIIMAVVLLGPGCASMDLSRNMAFSPAGGTAVRQISVYASPEAQAFVIEKAIFGGPPMGRSYRIPVGEALIPNAQRCLSSVSEKVDVVNILPPPQKGFTVDLDFPEKGDIDIGLTVFSSSPVTLSLRARVRSQDGRVMWEKTVKKTASAKSHWQIAAIIPIFGALGHDTAIVLSAEKSLQQCLEAIRAGMLQDKEVFLREQAR